MPQLQQDEVLVEIPLGGGLKQDAAQAWVQAPGAGDLINCMPDKDGRVVKVPGASDRSAGAMSSSGNSVMNSLFTDGAVVGVNTSEGTWLYDDTAGSPGSVPTHELSLRAASIRSEPFTAADTSIWFPDSAVGGAYEAFVWQTDPNDDLPRGYLMIRHRDTRAIVYGPRALTGDVHSQFPQPRVISDGTYFLVLANRNFSVQPGVIAWRIPIAGGSLSSGGTVNTASARPLLDVLFDSAISTSALVAVAQNNASTYEVRRVSFASPPVWNSTFTSIASAVNAASLGSDGSKLVSAIGVDTTRAIKTYEINVGGGSSTAGVTFTANWTPGSTPAMQTRVAIASQGSGTWALFWSLAGAPPGTAASGTGIRGTTEWRVLSGSPTLVDATPAPSGSVQVHYVRNYVLASHAFRPSLRGAHVALAYLWTDAVDAVRDATELSNNGTNDSGSYTLQDHGFLVEMATVTTIDDDSAEVSDLAVAPIARFGHDMQYAWDSALSGGAAAEGQHAVPRWTSDADGNWRLATLRIADRRGSFTAINSFTRAGAATQYIGAHVKYDPTPPPLRHVNSGRTVHFPGGFHAVFDGVQVAESTPFYMPERPEIQDYNSGSTTPTGVYAFKVLFFWEDARGNVHRTAPSRASRRWAATGAPANTGIAVSYAVPPLLTALAARHNRQVLVEIYRTPDLSVAGQAEVYERLYRGPVQAHATDPHMGTYSMTAAAATYNTDGHGLYTDLGELGAEPPPALLDVATFAGRLVGIHADNPNQLWVTKLVQEGVAPEWHNVLTIPVPDADIDGAVALGALDDKLVVLTKRRILYVYGDGPDQTGAGGFAPPTEVADQVGTSRPDGVIRTPAGIVVWTGPDGSWLLTPGMSVQPFGREVEDAVAASTFAWAATNPAAGLLHVGLADGTFLCWDWTRNVWHKRTRSSLTVHALEIGTKMWRLRSDIKLRRENASAEDPDGNTNQSYTSPWIRLDSSQGFQRVRWVLLGLYSHGITNGRLKVAVGHDYQAGDTQTAIWYESSGVSLELSALTRLLLSLHVKKQKCQSIRVHVHEESPDGTPGTYAAGTGFALERLTLHVKHKGGRYRLLRDAAKK